MRAAPCGAAVHQCENKVRHLTRDHAKQALKAMRANGATGRHLSFYSCPHCGFFHLGRKPRVLA